MFTSAEKTDIRRFCGYGPYGGSATPMNGYRFFRWEGTLEYRMNNLTSDEEAVVRTTYLTNLNALEAAIVSTGSNLDTDSAAIWKHNKNEQRDREALFSSWQRRLAGFLGIPPGPALANGDGLRLVV